MALLVNCKSVHLCQKWPDATTCFLSRFIYLVQRQLWGTDNIAALCFSPQGEFSSGRIASARGQLTVERNLETGGVMMYQED